MFQKGRDEKVTREQVKEQFPDATEEQITAILNINGTDLTAAKKNNVDPKELKRLQERDVAYQKLLDADLTDAEKIQKALKEADDTKAEYAKKTNRLDVEKILISAGLEEDDYSGLIDGIVSEDAEKSKSMATSLANMLNKQKEATEQKVKEELMDKTKTPGGSGGSGDEGEKTGAEIFAEAMVKESASGAKGAEDIIGAYK